jgi:hypothetical protein
MNLTPDDDSPHALLADVAQFYQGCLTDKAATGFLTEHGLMDAELLKRLEVGYCNGSLMKTLSEEQRSDLTDFGLIKGNHETLLKSLVFPCKNDGRVTGFLGMPIRDPRLDIDVFSFTGGLIGESVLDVYRDEIVVANGLIEFLVLQRLGFPNTFVVHYRAQTDGLLALSRHRVKRAIVFNNAQLKELLLQAVPEVEHRGVEVRLNTTAEEVSVPGTVESSWNDDVAVVEKNGRGQTNQGARTLQRHKDFWTARRGSLSYRMSGMKQGFTTVLKVSLKAEKDGKPYVDVLDLLSARARNNFAKELAEIVDEQPAAIGQDLLYLLDELEKEEEHRSTGGATAEQPLTTEQEAAGMAFLRNPDLLDEIAKDLDALGYAGEEANKQVAYLVATSRLQDDPLNMLVVSGSGAGKSALIDAVKKLIPSPEVVSFTSLSDQALNYLKPDGLLHKLMVLGEAVHGEVVNHQLREIISSKELSRMVTVRDERTGKPVSKMVRTPTVVSLMMSTTHRNHNPENLTRYLILHTDESEEQTARIHRVQNSRLSLESLTATASVVPSIIEKHHAAQRLLRPVNIVAPEGLRWGLPTYKLRARRDNQALNNLMVAICFLRQFQKERKVERGISYIECDAYDRETAWKLFSTAVMPSTYREHPEAITRLYDTIRTFCAARAEESQVLVLEVVFDQRVIRKAVNWMSAESVKLYFRKLVELDYLVPKSGGNQGQRKTYSLAEDLPWSELEGGTNGT